MRMYDGAQEAFVGNLRLLLEHGEDVTVRGQKTKELLSFAFQIRDPMRRVILSKHRNGNIFAQIAETFWMLGGRDDLSWLERYIPQCYKYSDDGKTWRAAYGPRLRHWQGTDQITTLIHRLRKDPQTRQAVISLWDPARDNIEDSKDYPCNNWLHFIIRDNSLHLNVVVRSNDAIYGFSHADFFGWSVLQQFVASSLGVRVGIMTWFASSYHLYERHFEMAEKIVAASTPQNDGATSVVESVYDIDIHKPPMFIGGLRLDWFDHVMKIGSVARHDIDYAHSIVASWEHNKGDNFWNVCSTMLVLYNEYLHMQDNQTLEWVMDFAFRVASMPSSDLKMAAIEFFVRKIPKFVDHVHDYVYGNEKLYLISVILG